MTDYFDHLERALADATARHYGRSTHGPRVRAALPAMIARGRRATHPGAWRRRPLPVVLVALAIGGSATATVAALVNSTSAPLTGFVPALPGLTGAGLRYDVPVTPDLEPGNAGWCSYPRFSLSPSSRQPSEPRLLAAGGTCGPAPAAEQPIILGGGEESLFWMIVSSRVAGLRIDAHTVLRPRSDPRLPHDWRAVVAFTPAFNARNRPLDRSSRLPIPTPLDAQGRPIALGAVTGAPQIAVRSVDPHRPGRAACAIGAVALTGVTRQWEVVAVALPAHGSTTDPGAVYSCARSWYEFDPRAPAISAAVLINPTDPRHGAARLPGLAPTTTPAFFTEDGGSAGDITARRIGAAWVVVQGGPPAQRTRLLRALQVHGTALAGQRRSTGRRS